MNEPMNSTNPFGNLQDNQVEYLRVGFGPRALAWVIDLLLAGLFASALAAMFMSFDLSMSTIMADQMAGIEAIYELLGVPEKISAMVLGLIPALTLGGIVGGIMYALIEGLTGASPGKRVMKIAIAHQDATSGDTALWIRRFAIKHIGAILAIFMLVPSLSFVDTIGNVLGFVIFIGYFFVLGESRLALHDRIAQTAVYYKEDIR